jgi:hypothetical protein
MGNVLMAMTEQEERVLRGFAQGILWAGQSAFDPETSSGYRMGNELKMAVTTTGLGGAIGLQGRLAFIENKLALMDMAASMPNSEIAELRTQIEALRREVAELTELNQIANNETYGAYA